MNHPVARKTPARSAVTEFLYSCEFPVDVEQIVDFLRSKNMNTNKVTVYRTVDFLFQSGIIDRLEFGEGKFRYEVKKEDHHHLVCNNCGKVEDVEDKYMNNLEKNIYRNKGFLVKNHSLEFFGLCQDCQK